jgi:hypothetical protein
VHELLDQLCTVDRDLQHPTRTRTRTSHIAQRTACHRQQAASHARASTRLRASA